MTGFHSCSGYRLFAQGVKLWFTIDSTWHSWIWQKTIPDSARKPFDSAPARRKVTIYFIALQKQQQMPNAKKQTQCSSLQKIATFTPSLNASIGIGNWQLHLDQVRMWALCLLCCEYSPIWSRSDVVKMTSNVIGPNSKFNVPLLIHLSTLIFPEET